jgi:mRNA-degrading endonuclease toxin of MazEF toxin-antitoxin module
VGHEQGKTRPSLVVSHDGLNHHAQLLLVCPFTTRPPRYPSEVPFPVGVLPRPSTLLCYQAMSVSTDRVLDWWGPIKDPVLLRQVREAFLEVLGITGGQQ